ncbi:isopentenyl-diphosphate Delta-isomerase [Pseudomonas gingeri]|uniref:Isopentenyl-diphosphate Delta-isomerase n=1 Tax=Pseudomonas gingeri TaxID=117681 RepID=A0A7Y8CJY7_9PSED|nr:isopentenyl-diphosphate Delta-isomerase [Pseudomonas gingeri]NWB26761.1 isopentenyl-diphosphate Delta-isomerase [Pseudomonas gingeri]NWC32689.1 isopentenyl-diphosphate Delta-isomerase [Pseudomonas gingeri]NWD07139.1 isopentenyl-diphosphate Delta-isomerase [Pseudomonas gingeri]NWD51300.1 isopentenyl-diphosphate Delta-isomerase [Pseudomonas gingeri]NWE31738.1 isopentenyl-diphosphate Delta-isomerase [Pseudomonas gingeri]
MEETLILVDEDDCETGSAHKLFIHQQGLRHRAFSIFIFDEQGCLLLQQRALGKYHSQGLWTNTCCGHPRLGEQTHAAAQRRLFEEMGLTCPLKKVASLLYREQVSNDLIEHEFDHLFVGTSDAPPAANPEEALAWKWMLLSDIPRCIAAEPQQYTVWFRRIFETYTLASLRAWQQLAVTVSSTNHIAL